MNQLSNHKVTTMSSRDIASLTGKEHKNVLRTIRDLISAKVLAAQIEPLKFEYRGQQFDYYELNKRDSLVLVARLSPEFTAAIVDRWQELESANFMQLPDFTNPAIAARAWADKHEAVMQLERKVAGDAPKVDFADRVEKSSGVLIGDFAKAVGTGERRLFAWLRANGYLISTAGRRHNTPYQEYVDRGYFDVTERAFETPAGEVKASFTTHITGKGQIAITRKLKECGMIQEVGK